MAKTIFKVMTLNLRFGLADDGPNSWKHRKKALALLLRHYPSRILGFQEANDFQITYLQRILPDYDFIGRRDPSPSFWQHNVIFFQRPWRCIANDHFFLSPTPDIPSRMPRSRWPRQGTIGVFQAPRTRQVLACVNTHFDFDPDVQAASAMTVLERLDAIAASYPAILMGDFNAAPGSPCYRIFTRPHPAAGLAPDPFVNVWQAPFPGTFHNFTGRPTNSSHIDWVLYRGRLELSACRIVRETFDNFYPSDHFPVQADFRFLPAA